MKTIKHIYKYLTNATYRAWVDLATQQEWLDRNQETLEENLKWQSKPIFHIKNTK